MSSTTDENVLQFRVPIPSSLLQRNKVPQPRKPTETPRHGIGYGNNSCQQSYFAPSMWGSSTDRRKENWDTMSAHGFSQHQTDFTMRPPPAPISNRGLFHSVVDESSMGNPFLNNRLIHSTPLNRHVGKPQTQSLFGAPTDSFFGPPSWTGSGSIYRGNESVRSITSSNTEFINNVFQKALNIYLERSAMNPEAQNMVIQVANGLRTYVQEAAEEAERTSGSVRSHYSKQASIIGLSTASDRTQDKFHLVLAGNRLAPSRQGDISPTRSILCSSEVSVQTRRIPCLRRLTEEPSKFITTVVENPVHPKKRTYESDNSDDDCVSASSSGKSVRKKLGVTLTEKDIPTAVQVFNCNSSVTAMTSGTENKRTEKGKKKSVKSVVSPQLLSATPCVRKHTKTTEPITTSKQTQKKLPASNINAGIKQKTISARPKQKDDTCDLTTITLSVKCTRSGRNVKRPNYYIASCGTNLHYKKMSSDKNKPLHEGDSTVVVVKTNTNAEVSRAQFELTTSKLPEQEFKKPRERSGPKRKTVVNKPEAKPKVHPQTRSGRTVKPTNIFGDIEKYVSLKPEKSTKRKVPTKKEIKKNRQIEERKESPITQTKLNQSLSRTDSFLKLASHNNSLDWNDLSIDGDFFIPEVTQSTRRGGKKIKGLKTMAAQTPPLMHFTSNLHPKLVSTVTPAQQTPDWHLSQRTQSEVMQFQKRKVNTKNKKAVPPCPDMPVRRPRQTKAMMEAKKLVCGTQPPNAGQLQLLAPTSYSDSEESE